MYGNSAGRDPNYHFKYPDGKCEICGKIFHRTWPKARRCKSCIRLNNKKIEQHTIVGYYVYGWYHLGESLPFYIGKGKGLRGYRNSKVPKIRIYRDNLTSEGALLVESVLIDLFKELGADLMNKNNGMSRQEKNPLEMKSKFAHLL